MYFKEARPRLERLLQEIHPSSATFVPPPFSLQACPRQRSNGSLSKHFAADIATIAGATDKVIRVTGLPDWLLAVDFQAGHDALAKLPDLLLYNSALFRRHGWLVRSLLVLLHPGRAAVPQPCVHCGEKQS